MSKIFLTSDLHLCHDREFLYKPRGFDNITDHNIAILKNWNNAVAPDDDVYILGDLMLNDNDTAMRLLKQLKGNIHIIRGNHDSDTRMELYDTLWNVVEICEGKFLNYKNYHLYLSHYPCLCGNHDENKPLKSKMISLCGHSHTTNPFSDWDKGIIYHCELDAHNNTPKLLDEILEEINQKHRAR